MHCEEAAEFSRNVKLRIEPNQRRTRLNKVTCAMLWTPSRPADEVRTPYVRFSPPQSCLLLSTDLLVPAPHWTRRRRRPLQARFSNLDQTRRWTVTAEATRRNKLFETSTAEVSIEHLRQPLLVAKSPQLQGTRLCYIRDGLNKQATSAGVSLQKHTPVFMQIARPLQCRSKHRTSYPRPPARDGRCHGIQ